MKWVLRSLGLVVVIAAVLGVGLMMLPGDRIAQVAVDQLRAQTGRAVTLKGDTTVSFYPVLGASTGAVEIANAPWSDSGPFMIADSLKIGVDLVSLLQGAVKITGLEVVNPDLLLERAADGRANWDLGVEGVAPSGQPAGRRNPLALSLDRALITGGQVRYLDHETGRDARVGDLSVDLRWPEYRGGATFDASGRLQGAAALSLSGEVTDLAALIEGALTEGRVAARAGGGTVQFDGHIGLPLQMTGTLDASLPDTAAFLGALGLAGVDLPAGLGRTAQGAATLTVTRERKLVLEDLDLGLDQNRLRGNLEADLSRPVPRVTADLSAGALSFAGGDGAGAGGSGGGDDGWSRAPIDAGALGLFDGRIALTAQTLRIAGLSFADAAVTAEVEQSRAVVTLSRLAGYSGSITGQLVANNRSGLSVAGSLTAGGVEMETLLTDLAGVRRFTGRAEATVDLLGAGNSVQAIMDSLSGKGRVAMGRGTIKGVDLDSLMRNGLATGGTTVFDSLTASFTVDKGDLFNEDLLLSLPVLSATGAGRVGLGARDIDYLFTPRTASAGSEGGIVIPVRIRGPWSDPKIWPDMERAIDLNLKDQKDAARRKAEEKLKERLGAEEGQSVEDAAKQKLEKEVIRGLNKLFK